MLYSYLPCSDTGGVLPAPDCRCPELTRRGSRRGLDALDGDQSGSPTLGLSILTLATSMLS